MKQAKTFETRGRKFGGEPPLICTPLVGRNRDRILAEATTVMPKKPDIIEWRVDYFEGIGDVAAVLDVARALRAVVGELPIIFTRRSTREGGEPIPIGDDEVVRLYAAVAESRLVEFLDFEMSNDPDHLRQVRESTRSHECRLILSYHNFGYTPGVEFLVQRFLEAERLGADVAKVAVMPRDRGDVLTLLAATAEADSKGGIPLISMSMGPLGSLTRMIGGAFGSSLSFAVGDTASAPGQIPIADLVAVYDILRRARRPMKTIRWGMLGCGEVAETKSGPGLYRAANSQLVAVADRSPDRAEAFARRHGVARWHDDAEAIIGAADIDAVYVATMTESHRDFVLRCAAAGKPVLTEKPMAMSHAGAQQMIAACRGAGVPLWVAYYRRALPRFLKVRDLVRDGAIGPVRMVTTRHFQRIPTPEAMRGPFWGWRLDPARSGGGIFFEAVGHTLDILDFILGPIESARSFADNQAGVYPPEDVVAASFRYASGVLGSGAWCFTADCDDEFNEIIGAAGRIRFPTFPPLAPPAGRPPVPILLTRGDAVEEFPITDPPYVHQPLIQSVVDELNGQGRCPSTGDSAARTARVIEDCLAEFNTGRAPGPATAPPDAP